MVGKGSKLPGFSCFRWALWSTPNLGIYTFPLYPALTGPWDVLMELCDIILWPWVLQDHWCGLQWMKCLSILNINWGRVSWGYGTWKALPANSCLRLGTTIFLVAERFTLSQSYSCLTMKPQTYSWEMTSKGSRYNVQSWKSQNNLHGDLAMFPWTYLPDLSEFTN